MKMLSYNIKKIYAAFENNMCKQKYYFYLYSLIEKIIYCSKNNDYSFGFSNAASIFFIFLRPSSHRDMRAY